MKWTEQTGAGLVLRKRHILVYIIVYKRHILYILNLDPRTRVTGNMLKISTAPLTSNSFGSSPGNK